MPRIAEFTSYTWIKKELAKFGWVDKNPIRNPTGQVYAQQECLDHPEIQKQLIRDKPEFVLKLSENEFLIIEAKSRVDQLDQAFQEAIQYAEKINQSAVISAPLVSGVAGNDDDGYVVRTAYRESGGFETVTYNQKELTSLLSPELAQDVLSSGNSSLATLEIDESHLLRVAEAINEILHSGSINKDERAAVMANLLLAFVDDTEPNFNATPTVFVNDLNSRAEHVLSAHNKQEFFDHIKIRLPSRPDAQEKYRASLVKTIFDLKKINIKAAMNSGTDVLGKFYEVFLKYGNGAKDIGIVLTPRHITKFVTEVLDVNHEDIVYDPTCGTGGFLVSAFDYVRSRSTKDQTDKFKNNKIFGIEQQPKVAVLAIVNMIFRGDGKNNIVDNDCLSQTLVSKLSSGVKTADYISGRRSDRQNPPVTKVMMNPPFALRTNDEKEYKFVEHALSQMEDGGLLFSVLPVSVMFKTGIVKTWRKEQLLRNNSLLAVVRFPEDLFYPVGVQTLGIFVRKGIPHPDTQNVLWARALRDGYQKKKGKRLPDNREANDYVDLLDKLTLFMKDPTRTVKSEPRYLKTCPVDFADESLELVPEAYLDDTTPTPEEITKGAEDLLRSTAAYMIRDRKL